MWNPRKPWHQGSFAEPVAIPATSPADGPLLYLPANEAWVPLIIGAMMQLILPSTWDTTDPAALREVQTQVTDLMASWGKGDSVQAGSASVTILAGTAVGYAGVTYPTAYSAAPIVVAGGSSGTLIVAAEAITEIGFVLSVTAPTPVLTDTTETVDWLSEAAS